MTRNKALYEILGVESNAEPKEIKRAYRLRALSVHPDKCPQDENAQENFQHLKRAYDVLSDPERRELYDETGDADGSEESESFKRAYETYRFMFSQVTEVDIDSFASSYKKSEEERKDVLEFIQKFEGDVTKLLEWIPLSEWDEAKRFETIVEELFETESLPEKWKKKFAHTKKGLHLNALRNKKKAKKEATTLEPNDGFDQLALQIRANKNKRAKQTANFLDRIESKSKKSKKQKK